MPTIITHSFVGYMFGKFIKAPKKLLVCTAICGFVPDLDSILFKFNVAYNSLFGHRGFTHSILFALLFAFLMFLIFFRKDDISKKEKWIIYSVLFISIMSHSILDAFTDGGLGVAFFSPFITERYFFGWNFIPVAPIAISRFLTLSGLKVMISEVLIVWLPIVIFYLVYRKIIVRNR